MSLFPRKPSSFMALVRLMFAASLFLICFAASYAQQYSGNKPDQNLRGSGRVNPSTLGVEFDLPLASYPGRGINVPVSLSYSSKLWRLQYNYTSGQVNAPGCDTINRAVYGENTASGWTTSLSFPYIEYTGKDNMYDQNGRPIDDSAGPCGSTESYQYGYIKRLTLHLPGGETHELRANDTPVIYDPSSSCPNSPCDPNQAGLQANWDTTYYAADGSNVKYIEDSTTNTYRVLLPDGSFYDLSLSASGLGGASVRKAAKYTDRNGNFTTYHDPDAGHPNGYWTDTLGRNIPIPLAPSAPAAAGDQAYQIPGLGGANLNYTLHWKQLKGATAADSALTDFNQTLSYLGDRYWPQGATNWQIRTPALFQSGDHHTQTDIINDLALGGATIFNPIVLTEIDLPDGRSYRFTYDIYGRIERIYYPTGGEERFTYQTLPSLSPGQYDFYKQANVGVATREVYETADTGRLTSGVTASTRRAGFTR